MGNTNLRLTDIKQQVDAYVKQERMSPEEGVERVDRKKGTSADRFHREMKALADIRGMTTAERGACVAINAIAERLVREFDAVLASTAALERGAVLKRCGDIEQECDDAIRQVWSKAPRAVRDTSAVINNQAIENCLVVQTKAQISQLLAQHGLTHEDKYGRSSDQAIYKSKAIEALKRWTWKTHVEVVFDSEVDEFTGDTLVERILGKPNMAFIKFTTDGDVFGAYTSVGVKQKWITQHDPDIFIFSFESHGRCMTPQRFFVNKENRDRAQFMFPSRGTRRGDFLRFEAHSCGSCLMVGGDNSCTVCYSLSTGFDGIDDTTLAGVRVKSHKHHCTRLVAVHLF